MIILSKDIVTSIVIATYNKASLLDLSLESIFRQNVPFKYEVIIVDDGSSDNTSEICKKYEVIYEYLDRPYYCNPAMARNVGFKLSKGSIIIQQCEIIHFSDGVINSLTSKVKSKTMHFATVYNAVKTNHGYEKSICYSGNQNPRPFFFLGATTREDLFAVGGYDEDFDLPGYDDNWLADCLIKGRKCTYTFWDDIIGLHLDHERPNLDNSFSLMSKLYSEKVKKNLFFAYKTSLSYDFYSG
jgi:glycosyltransferase involved in cell wall biosynthesis